MKKLLFGLLSIILGVQLGVSAGTLRSTTLSTALALGDDTMTVASATGVTANMIAFVDQEAMKVLSISGTQIKVQRGLSRATGHASGATIWIDLAQYFSTYDRSGSCTSATELILPVINTDTGDLFYCTNNVWDKRQVVTSLTASLGNHLTLNSASDSKQPRINSRSFTQTSGSSMGFQSKPDQTVASTGSVIGAEISARASSGIAVANLIGLHADSYLKGTAAGTISGDVRGLQVELVTDDAGTRTISGNVTGIRIRAAFSATTLTGTMEAIRIEKAETQTNSQNWDSVLTLTSNSPGVWNSTDVDSGDTEAGYFKVLINGVARYVITYSDAPTL